MEVERPKGVEKAKIAKISRSAGKNNDRTRSMRVGDIQGRIVIGGEPNRLFMIARSTFSGIVPDSASVTIIKRNRSRLDDSPDFHFGNITRTERKLADVRLGQLCTKLSAEENGVVAALHDVLWDWLWGRIAVPRYEKPEPFARVGVQLSGDADNIITAAETLRDLEPLSSISIGPVFLQDEPRHPEVRWLLDLRSAADVASARADFRNWSGQVPTETAERVDQLTRRVSKLHKRRSDDRRRKLRHAAEEALGDYAEEWLTTPGRFGRVPIASVDDCDFEDDLRWLSTQTEPTKRRARQ